ncbi:MAG: rRNA maturation RNase YbeY [Anaerolineales bacterium]
MIFVYVDKRYQVHELEPLLKRAALAALKHQGEEPSAELSLVVTGDAKLKNLNTQFRGEAHPTDVLSFPSGEERATGKPGYLGDVVISLPRARVQAKAGGHSLLEEIQLLTVHGILHLLGHDHSVHEAKLRMWASQDEILRKLGLRIKSPLAEQSDPGE